MSLAVIRNGLVTTLTACGPWVAAEVSTCDFGVMETVSSCAIVLMPGRDTQIQAHRGGDTANQRGYLRMWDISGGLYVKFTGDPKALLSKVWQGHDDLFNTIRKDDSLAGAACAAMLTNLSFNPREGAEIAGTEWALVRFSVQAEEF